MPQKKETTVSDGPPTAAGPRRRLPTDDVPKISPVAKSALWGSSPTPVKAKGAAVVPTEVMGTEALVVPTLQLHTPSTAIDVSDDSAANTVLPTTPMAGSTAKRSVRLLGRPSSQSEGSEQALAAPPTPAPAAAPPSAGEAVPVTPAPPPVTPAPPRPAGEVAIAQWVEESGLGDIDGLTATLLGAVNDLTKLSDLSDAEQLVLLKPLKLKSLKLRKVQAALISLRSEREVFSRKLASGGSPDQKFLRAPVDSMTGRSAGRGYHAQVGAGDAAVSADASVAPIARTGERKPPRFKPRTRSAAVDALPATPEGAARSLGLTGPSEARELGELATLLGCGRPSQRASKWEANINAGVLASAAAKEAAVASKAASQAAAEKENKKVEQVARAALGEVETPHSRKESKQIDSLRLFDLPAALEEAAAANAAAGVEFSPARMAMIDATAPRVAKAPKARRPRKKPPIAPGSERPQPPLTRAAAAAQRVAITD
jgi:hypothetical protein